jgi:predicted XRE-type DNA-binding protein
MASGYIVDCIFLAGRPEARGQRPEAKRPEARGQKPEARSQKPEARSQRPEAKGQGSGAETTGDRTVSMGDKTYQQADGDSGWAEDTETTEQSSLLEQAPDQGRPSVSPAAAEHLRLRTELMDAVRDLIRRRGLRQRDAAALFGVAQPRVSDLVRGKLALFSIDTLVDMLAAGGVRVEAKLHPVRATARPAERATDEPAPVRKR